MSHSLAHRAVRRIHNAAISDQYFPASWLLPSPENPIPCSKIHPSLILFRVLDHRAIHNRIH
jgi:hypothetical protein